MDIQYDPRLTAAMYYAKFRRPAAQNMPLQVLKLNKLEFI